MDQGSNGSPVGEGGVEVVVEFVREDGLSACRGVEVLCACAEFFLHVFVSTKNCFFVERGWQFLPRNLRSFL